MSSNSVPLQNKHASPTITQLAQTSSKKQPWVDLLANGATVAPRVAESQGLTYNFEKGERMVIDGSAQRGSGKDASGGQWTIQAESREQ